jgi:hypothetical protein
MQFLPSKPKFDEKTRAAVDLYSLENLRKLYQEQAAGDIRLREGMMITREGIGGEIRWRLWWSRVENRATLFFALVAAIASVIAVIQGFRPGH